MSASCIEKTGPKHTKTIRNDHHGAQDAQLAAVKPRRVGDHGAGDGPYLWRRAHRGELTINTWSDETTGKKADPGPSWLGAMEHERYMRKRRNGRTLRRQEGSMASSPGERRRPFYRWFHLTMYL